MKVSSWDDWEYFVLGLLISGGSALWVGDVEGNTNKYLTGKISTDVS